MSEQDEGARARAFIATLRKMAQETTNDEHKQAFLRAAAYYEKKVQSLTPVRPK